MLTLIAPIFDVENKNHTNYEQSVCQEIDSSLIIHKFTNLLFSIFNSNETHPLSIPDAQQILGVTYRTAQKTVQKLAAADILMQMTVSNYGKFTVASEILEIDQ